MAQLQFEQTINLTTYAGNSTPAYVESLVIGNEPNNDIWQYYIKNRRPSDKGSKVFYSNYDKLQWDRESRHLTSQAVKRIGIKNFPQVGAIGFYVMRYEERSKILVPIHVASKKYKAPEFSFTETSETFTFTMKSPKGVTYMCYRIVIRLKAQATEYITYEETLTVDKPTAAGTYDIYCIGYINEGEAVSEDSKHYSKVIE